MIWLSLLANAAPSRAISCVSLGACFFYSAIALLYIALFTSINVELAENYKSQRLPGFLRDCRIYLFHPLIQVKKWRKNVAGANGDCVIANSNTVPQKIGRF